MVLSETTATDTTGASGSAAFTWTVTSPGGGGAASPGFQGTWTSSDAAPTAFTVNGSACTT